MKEVWRNIWRNYENMIKYEGLTLPHMGRGTCKWTFDKLSKCKARIQTIQNKEQTLLRKIKH